MAQQNMSGGAGYAPLRVQRTFRRFDDGRGARAAALAESLGVILDSAPAIIKSEGDKAFKAGMEARIDGVKRENADTKNKSMLGFMFSKRASDGFDYQDAQLEIPVIQMESMLQMESALRESRNPEDFRAYIEGQDAALQQKFADRSDIYRYTVAEALQKTRADQARVFTSWVQSNREKDRRTALAAAAKAQAKAAKAAIDARNSAFGAAIFDSALGSTDSQSPSAPSGGPVAPTGTLSTSGMPTATGESTVDVSGGSQGTSQVNQSSQPVRLDTQPELLTDKVLSTGPAPVSSKTVNNFAQIVTTAAEQLGVPASEAKTMALSEWITAADLMNDPAILQTIDPRFLETKDKQRLADAIDKLTVEKIQMDERQAEANALARQEEAARIEADGLALENSLAQGVIEGDVKVYEVEAQLLQHPYFQQNPDERAAAANRIIGIRERMSDPMMEQISLASARERLVKAAITGNPYTQQLAYEEAAVSLGSDENRKKFGEYAANIQQAAEDMMFDGLDVYESVIEDKFPTGIGPDETPSLSILGDGKSSPVFDPDVQRQVNERLRMNIMDIAQDWYNANSGGQMTNAIRYEIQSSAFERTLREAEMLYKPLGAPTSSEQVSSETSSVDAATNRLLGIAD